MQFFKRHWFSIALLGLAVWAFYTARNEEAHGVAATYYRNAPVTPTQLYVCSATSFAISIAFAIVVRRRSPSRNADVER